MKLIRILLIAIFVAHWPVHAESQVPALISYQGHITDSAGTALGANSPTNRTVTFRIWNSPSGSAEENRLYSESQVVTFVNGEFSVNLGNGTPVNGETNANTIADIWTTKDAFLGITVDDGDSETADPELAPRQQIVTTAFAFRAKHTEVADIAKQVENGAITQNMLANNSVTINQIADQSIQSSKIIDNSISTVDIGDGQVTLADIAANAVDSLRVVDNSIGSQDILDGSIHSHDIRDGDVALVDLVAAVRDSLCPPGTILSYAGDNAPAGWLMCDGNPYNRSQYPVLFSLIGTRFGHGNQSTTFNVPDLRGVFLRGRDGSRNLDPDKNSRQQLYSGGAAGNNVGSLQYSAFQNHFHISPYGENGITDFRFGQHNYGDDRKRGASGTDTDNQSHGYTSPAGDSSETRPINVYVNYIIKY